MPLESKFTEQQLFDQLISSLVHTTWVSLGKIKNPITDKIEKDLHMASVNIDMVDMLYKRMDGNLSESEDKYLSQILSELKSNYINDKSQTSDFHSDDSSESEENNFKSDNNSKNKSEKQKSTSKTKNKI
ncbi:uncharacterized protein METZ01_LOCUS70201 [marine metagenome]|uniref:DUF1844 domain-containing protein n=1 Tax=marine metagenome TaxID=408172 RepID=A0A381TR64_9ZZZZ|tara:strand:- start:495 stop:884 length:390 start_codon:yes stop_codon:yes gene_type:complete